MKNIFGILIGLFVGGIFLYFGVTMLRTSIHDVQTNLQATGRVVSYAEVRSSKGKISYSPVIDFTTPDQQTHRFQSAMSSSRQGYAIGGAVPILYDPTNPEHARINSLFDLYIFPGIFAVVGALVMFLLILLPPFLKKRREAHASRLRSIGVIKEATITGTAPTGLVVNGQKYYAVQAEILDPVANTVRKLKSDSFPYDPIVAIQGKTKINVYVNPNNPKDYWMDTSNFPTLAE